MCIKQTVGGVQAGVLTGSLKDGVGSKIDMFVSKGQTKYYLKNGNELWAYLDIKITFDGSFEGDYKILSF